MSEEGIFDELSSSYRRMEDDDNEEVSSVEYLDMDFETIEIHTEELASEPTKRAAQPSIPKSKAKAAANTPRFNLILPKHSDAVPERSIVRARSLAGMSTMRNSKVLATETVHAAVDDINAKLADSAKLLNGSGAQKLTTNDRNLSESFRTSEENESFLSNNSVCKEFDSLDLFFQSMAQTVLNLPSQVQAKIKMDICQVIATAEMKYCTKDTTHTANKL